MASRSSLSSLMLFGNLNEEDKANQAINIQETTHMVQQAQLETVSQKRQRNSTGVPYPDVEVIALSPTTLTVKNRFICDVCHKGFPRDQNLQLHRRGHNLPWKLKPKSATDGDKRKVYLCPEPSCINHQPSHALGDLTGIKKHYSRKHGEKKYKCTKCEKMYAVRSDLKAHIKICGTKEYQCHCGTIFSRRDSFTTHKAFCDAVAEGIHIHAISSMDLNSYKPHPTFFGQSSDQQNQQKFHGTSDTQFFTNLVNTTTTPPKNLQLYNLSFMGNHINSGSGEGSSMFSGGSIVSHHSESPFLSLDTGAMPQLSAKALIQKAAILGSGSTSNTNPVTNFYGRYGHSSSNDIVHGIKSDMDQFIFGSGFGSSSFNHFEGATNMHEERYQGGLHSSNVGYTDDGKTFNSVEQQPTKNASFNMGFEQFSAVKITRDFLGVGMDMEGDISNDRPKSTFVSRSFL